MSSCPLLRLVPEEEIEGLNRVRKGLVAAKWQKGLHPPLVHRWGAGRSRGFAFAAFRSSDRKKFVGQLVDLCEEEGLEGIEFDWEGGEEELQMSEGCMRTPSDVFLCSGFQK